jgi:formylglycine-generating enzyme required for sulfatase activity
MTSLSGAVKFCFGSTGRDLIREADLIDRVMAACRHPNIVPLADVYLEGDTPWLMFEYVAGGNLTDWIHRLATMDSGKRCEQVLRALDQMTEAVGSFHTLTPPIVHRDLKPANILLDSTTKKLRITDFGIGAVTAQEILRQESRGQTTQGGRLQSYLRGSHTPLYSSPQQRQGSDPDPRDDVHALGVIAYQMFTGHLAQGAGPDFADDLRDAGASEDVIAVLGRCVAQKPERRPRDAGELWDMLSRVSRGKEVAPPPAIPAPAPHVPARKPERPPLLDSTEPTALTQADVQRIQKAWAEFLGVPVEQDIAIAPGVAMTFVLIPPGRFLMGSPENEPQRDSDETQHEVTLTKPFYLAKYPVTQEQYHAVAGTNPSHFKNVQGQNTSRFPVESVSWDDCVAWTETLTRKLNDRHVYRLPTEAEWEYTCRGGRLPSLPFGIGDGRTLSSTQANFDGDFPYGGAAKGPYLKRTCLLPPLHLLGLLLGGAAKEPYLRRTCPVGSYPANWLGLCDMHGNVWEWCADWYGDYPTAAVADPEGPREGSSRVDRGGGWIYFGRSCRAAYRDWYLPGIRDDYLGFRLARSSQSGPGESSERSP